MRAGRVTRLKMRTYRMPCMNVSDSYLSPRAIVCQKACRNWQKARVDDKSNRSRAAYAEGICESIQHSRIAPDGGTSRFAVLSRVAGFAIILLTAAKR